MIVAVTVVAVVFAAVIVVALPFRVLTRCFGFPTITVVTVILFCTLKKGTIRLAVSAHRQQCM